LKIPLFEGQLRQNPAEKIVWRYGRYLGQLEIVDVLLKNLGFVHFPSLKNLGFVIFFVIFASDK
jgi:hypothetical protein